MSPVRSVQASGSARRGADRIAIFLGEQVRAERIRRGWTLRQLGDRSGLSVAMIHHVESGRHASLDTYVRLATAFSMRLDAGIGETRPGTRSRREEDLVHAAMGELEATHFRACSFEVLIDEPYQHYQFAGRADVVVVQRTPPALLHIENRTQFPNIQDAAGTFNAKRAYLGKVLADRLGIARWQSEAHVLVAAWTSEMHHALRLRTETFRALCPDGAAAWADWWTGAPPTRGRAAGLIVLDPVQQRSQRSRQWIGLDDALRVRPRHRDYAAAAAALRQAGIGAERRSR